MYLFFSLLLSFLNEYFYRLRWKARSFMYFIDSFIITLWSYHPYQRTIRKLRVNGSKKVELSWWKNGSIFERKIWQWLIKTESNEMALIWVNNHVVFINHSDIITKSCLSLLITISAFLSEECILFSSAWLQPVVLPTKWKRLLMKMFENRGSRIER